MSPRLRWRWFFAWAAVGVVAIVGLFAVFALPLMVVAFGIAGGEAWRLSRREDARLGFVGAWCGAAVPVLYLAYINRDGPGQVCTRVNGGIACTEEWSPWPFVGIGATAVLAGTVVFALQRRRRAAAFDETRP